jgi:hypothetical protein
MMFRFLINDEPVSEWAEEPARHTASEAMAALRAQHPDAAIRIERKHIVPQTKPKLFRYDIFVPDGTVTVVDEEGAHERKITNLTVQSRPFQESERLAVLTEVQQAFPHARLTIWEVK